MNCWIKAADVILQKSYKTTIMNNVIPRCFLRYVNKGMLTKQPPTRLAVACPCLYVRKRFFSFPLLSYICRSISLGSGRKLMMGGGGEAG